MVHVVPPPVPAWVTVTVCDATPVADTVTIAVRAAVPVFCCAVTVPVPLLEPEAGLTVSQSWLSVAVQFVFDVMANYPVLLADAARFTVAGETESEGPAVQLVAGEPVPVGAVADVVMLILSRRAPSSR